MRDERAWSRRRACRFGGHPEPHPPSRSGSATASGANASDPLSHWLARTPGFCLVAARMPDGRYPSWSLSVPVPPGLTSGDGSTGRFAYRGWAPGLPEPAVLAVCTVPDEPGANEYFATRFGGRAMNAAELRAFARVTRVTVVEEWRATMPQVMQGGPPVYMTDGLASKSPLLGADREAGMTATVGMASMVECDPNAIIQDPSCGDETVPSSPPMLPSSEPDLTLLTDPSFSINPATGTVISCEARTDNLHFSTTPGFAGRLNVKASNTCPVPLPQYVSVSLKREACFLWVFCSWPTIASGQYSNPSATFAQANADTACMWSKSYMYAEGYHQTTFPQGVGSTWTRNPPSGFAWVVYC